MTTRHNVRVGSRAPQNGVPAPAFRSLADPAPAPDGSHPTWVPSWSSLPTSPSFHARPALLIFEAATARFNPRGEGVWSPCRSSLPSAATSRNPACASPSPHLNFYGYAWVRVARPLTPGPTAVELRGETEPNGPSPRPSPHSFLMGRGSQIRPPSPAFGNLKFQISDFRFLDFKSKTPPPYAGGCEAPVI